MILHPDNRVNPVKTCNPVYRLPKAFLCAFAREIFSCHLEVRPQLILTVAVADPEFPA
jgi:hypothetical protein